MNVLDCLLNDTCQIDDKVQLDLLPINIYPWTNTISSVDGV